MLEINRLDLTILVARVMKLFTRSVNNAVTDVPVMLYQAPCFGQRSVAFRVINFLISNYIYLIFLI